MPGWAFSARTASTTLSRMMVVSRQIGFSSVLETTYFLGAFMMSPNGLPGRHRLEGFGVNHIRAAAEQECVDILYQGAEGSCRCRRASTAASIRRARTLRPRSSSFPPGACMTPSNDTNSDTISFRIASAPRCIPSFLSVYVELAIAESTQSELSLTRLPALLGNQLCSLDFVRRRDSAPEISSISRESVDSFSCSARTNCV